MAGDVRSGRGPILLAFAIAAGALLYGGCDWSSHGDKSPYDYSHHTHPAIVRFHAVNWEVEPVGIESVFMFSGGGAPFRPGWSFAVPYETAAVFPLRRADTSTTTCSVRVVHFTGYQMKAGGDTTHLAWLDGNPNWACRMALSGEHPVLADGRSAVVIPGHSSEVGDTLIPGLPWIVEVELDMSGMFSRDTGTQWDELVIHPEYVHCQQVRQ